MGSAGRKRPGKNGRGEWTVKLNFRRQMFYAALAFASILAGYAVGSLFRDGGKPSAVRTAATTAGRSPGPWYSTQPPPPSLINIPDPPLFPDTVDEPGGEPVRPYEEALPAEIYEPEAAEPARKARPSVPAPPQAAAAPARQRVAAEAPPWRRFAVQAPATGRRPRIALVIDDMGVDQKRSARVIGLEGPLTLAFLTYAKNLAAQTAAARAAGHELLLHVSMEPSNASLDAGPNVLLRKLDPAEISRRLAWGLSRFSSFVGINNHMGSKFTADPAGMEVVMGELKRRGLLFLDSRTTAKTVGADLARRHGVPFAERNIFLDNVNDVAAVNARLAEVERLARRQGLAIAIGHPRDGTLGALPGWLATVQSRGFVLVPLSAVVSASPEGR